jgi:hypothetical protein
MSAGGVRAVVDWLSALALVCRARASRRSSRGMAPMKVATRWAHEGGEVHEIRAHERGDRHSPNRVTRLGELLEAKLVGSGAVLRGGVFYVSLGAACA